MEYIFELFKDICWFKDICNIVRLFADNHISGSSNVVIYLFIELFRWQYVPHCENSIDKYG